jgi:hypothetical protein
VFSDPTLSLSPFWTTAEQRVSGSSVATAFASGLACLLVYCNKLVDPDDEGYFRNRYNMRHTFRTMSVGQDQMFPVVQLFFERKFRELVLSEHSKKALSSLMVNEFVWSTESKKALSLLMEIIKVRMLIKAEEQLLNYTL